MCNLPPDEKEELAKLSFDKMCIKINLSLADDGTAKFSNLTKLLNLVRTLPYSNAEAERSFSMLKEAKTCKRNRLGVETLNSILVVRSALIACNEIARAMQISEAHLKFMKKDIYKFGIVNRRAENLKLFADV